MKKHELLQDAFGMIDDELITEARTPARTLSMKKRWRRIAMAAACLVLVVSMIPVSVLIGKRMNKTGEPFKAPLPSYEDSPYSAAQIEGMFGMYKTDGVATNAYTTFYLPNAEALKVSPLPNEDFLPIYQVRSVPKTMSRNEFETFLDQTLPRVEEVFGWNFSDYTIEERTIDYYNETRLEAKIKSEEYWIRTSQTETMSRMNISLPSHIYGMSLYGQKIQVDQTQSDEEIIESLTEIKERLCTVFGVSFQNVKINRYYSYNSEYGVSGLRVYFYNESAHPLQSDGGTVVSDYIELYFDNFSNYSGDVVSDTVLENVDITYVKYRTSAAMRYPAVATAKKVSLEQAEEWLSKGYVFGGHSCDLCMAAQDKVDFSDYDFVELNYVYFEEAVLPFYTFYKQLSPATETRHAEYGKTYVPAFEVTGMEEYFAAQQQNHKTSSPEIAA